MKIGLVRHFKVNTPFPEGKIHARDFSQWMRNYDILDVTPTEVDLRGVDWNKCYSSDLPRAVITAEAIYPGDIIKTPLIREISMKFTKEMEEKMDRKVSLYEWSVYSMINWAKKTEMVEEHLGHCEDRVNKFLDIMLKESDEDDNILVVCHGMIMTVLESELKKRGFKGETVVAADNGELFLLER